MPQAELSGDQAAVQVLEAAEAQVAVELTKELEKLAEKQIEEQAALEVKQVDELINMEEELQVEQQTAGQQVAEQIEEQKQKVGDELNHFSLTSCHSHSVPCPSPVTLHWRSFLVAFLFLRRFSTTPVQSSRIT